MKTSNTIDNEIIKSMAQAVFADQMANAIDELGEPSMSGENYYDHIGETPRVAFFKANEICGAIEHSNDGKTISQLYLEAIEADEIEDTKELRDEFGFKITMQALGHGVSWFDDHNDFEIKFPFYIENDIVIGKDDLRKFDGFDESHLDDEAKEIFDNAPEVTEFSSFFYRDKIIGIAKAAIIDANNGDYKNKQVAIDTLLVNVDKNIEAMCFAHRLFGGLYEANRNTIYQLKLNDIASEMLSEEYNVSKLDHQKFSSNVNVNDIKLGMMVYNWSVKDEKFHQTYGFEKPNIDYSAREQISSSIENNKTNSPSPTP